MLMKCPVCEEHTYNYFPRGYDGCQPIDPACGECENCGFYFMENGSHNEQETANYYKRQILLFDANLIKKQSIIWRMEMI